MSAQNGKKTGVFFQVRFFDLFNVGFKNYNFSPKKTINWPFFYFLTWNNKISDNRGV